MKRFLNIIGWAVFGLIVGFYIWCLTVECWALDVILDAASILTILLIGRKMTKYGRGVGHGAAALLEISVRILANFGPWRWKLEDLWWTVIADLILIALFYSKPDG